MHPLIESKKKEIEETCRRFGVKRLEIFGSAARGNDFDPERSDADFLVQFRAISKDDPLGEILKFEGALSSILGRDVDLIEGLEVDNPFLQRAIDRDREVIYDA